MAILIDARSQPIDWHELWDHRELLAILVWRDIKVRYKQTLFGAAWVIFQPVVFTAVFSIFFGKLAKISSDGLPYPLFSYLGLAVWGFFSAAVASSTTGIVTSAAIIKKVYFPRVLLVLAIIVTAFIDFLVSLIPLVAMLAYFHISPGIAFWFWIIPLLCLLFILTVGVGLFVAALDVRFRDVRYLISFLLQVGLFITPVIYPLSVIFDFRRTILLLNPLTGIIENLRRSLQGRPIDTLSLVVSLVVSLIIFLIGYWYFHKEESNFGDLV